MSSARSSALVRVPAESSETVTWLQEKREWGKTSGRKERVKKSGCTEAQVSGIDSCWEISPFPVPKITPPWAPELRSQLETGHRAGGEKFSMIISEEGEEMENRLGKEAWLAASRISSRLSCGFLLLMALCSPPLWMPWEMGGSSPEITLGERSWASQAFTLGYFYRYIPVYRIYIPLYPSIYPQNWSCLALWTRSSVSHSSGDSNLSLPSVQEE